MQKSLFGWCGLSLILGLTAVALRADPPPNDDFSAPTSLSGFPSAATGSNIEATLEPGEPALDQALASVWFQWTAVTSGYVQIDTLGSDFDTQLAVWEGSSLDALALIAHNDDFQLVQSAVFLNAVSGTVYRIAVYGYGGAQGTIALNITNDLYARITGTVTGPDASTPLEGIEVAAFVFSGGWWGKARSGISDAEGHYFIGGLPGGTYRIQFDDWRNGDYISEVYDDAPNLNSGADIAVSDGASVGGYDASLALASKISGTVTGPDETTPLPGILVSAFTWNGSWWEWVSDASTDDSGFYSIGRLPAGTYRIRFEDTLSGDYSTEVYDNAPNLDSGTDIEVPEATLVTDKDASLASAAKITGTVTGPDETTPLSGIHVTAYTWNGAWWDGVSSDYTDGDGFYAIGGLAPGAYRIRFEDDMNGDYIPEVFNDAPDLDSGITIEVSEGMTVSGKDASLSAASKISGTVTGPDETTPLPGIGVAAYRWNGSWWEQVNSVSTYPDGHYTIGGLAAGTYRVEFVDWANGDYAAEVYSNAPDLNSGLDIVLAEFETVSGIDASLAAGSKISGTVTGPDETTPLSGIEVTAYTWTGDWWSRIQSDYTDITGAYQIGGLLPGTYRVEFADSMNGNYVTEVYSNAPSLDAGTDIMLAEFETVAGIDASLAAGSKIRGTITGPDGTSPLPGITATAYSWNGSWWESISSGMTDSDGYYTIGGLPAGTYRVQFNDWMNGNYSPEVYSNAPDLDSGMDIVVPELSTVSGINAALDSASKITGTVTGPDGTTPLAGIDAVAHRRDGLNWTWVGSGTTDGAGQYSIGGLTAGTYRVLFRDWNNGDYVTEAFSNAPDLDSGRDIDVPEFSTVTGIDASLATASKIAGTITGPDGTTGLIGIDATAYAWSGSDWIWISYDRTDADGHYQIGGLPPGTYRVQFDDWVAGIYLSEVYNDAPDLDAGDDISLTEGMVQSGIDASLSDGTAVPEPIRIVGVRRLGAARFEILFTGPMGLRVDLREKTYITNAWTNINSPVSILEGTNSIIRDLLAPRAWWEVYSLPPD